MISDDKGGIDGFESTWYPVPMATVKVETKTGIKEHMGTYKHVKCLKYASGERNTCITCQNIPYLQSFKRRLMLRADKVDESGHRDINKVRFEYLMRAEKLDVLRQKNQIIECRDSELFLLQKQNLRLKLRVRTLKESLKEYPRRGDMKTICHHLTKAEE